VGSALPILDVISMLLRLGFRTVGLEPASNSLRNGDDVRVASRLDLTDLDLKSGETTR
jgi:hypothetical protein